jgi:hypothetical protein
LLWLFCWWDLAHYLLGWPQTSTLLISASQVARITGMSHGCLACHIFLIDFNGLHS